MAEIPQQCVFYTDDVFCCPVSNLRLASPLQVVEERVLDFFVQNRLDFVLQPALLLPEDLAATIARTDFVAALELRLPSLNLHAREFFIPHANRLDVAIELEEQEVRDWGFTYSGHGVIYDCPCPRHCRYYVAFMRRPVGPVDGGAAPPNPGVLPQRSLGQMPSRGLPQGPSLLFQGPVQQRSLPQEPLPQEPLLQPQRPLQQSPLPPQRPSFLPRPPQQRPLLRRPLPQEPIAPRPLPPQRPSFLPKRPQKSDPKNQKGGS
ncbi:hypothetical protein M430DRAFT_29038 [Amorphotheca resinae ATCC 22711]|uniref:Uncharacterized protein n=1 Tax=Amorphotheca resinae ATCC 22711 TaxID=857342 RepID=A0A2T3AYA0_AMORE|nr:hypothetical protein M430DRAFT_29038 [Amorphotheca resinae ATCC 22711]PSS15020.1 hypothetical protein M430DRAFT_29038 [Amorphotheca resinae ATCC 22711]